MNMKSKRPSGIMRATKRNGGRLGALLLSFLLLAALFPACQPTPEEEPVVNRGDGLYELELERARATADPAVPTPTPYAADARWSEVLELPNFMVTINAAVELPEAQSFPVYRIRPSDFTARTEDVASILRTLIPGADGVRENVMTREACQARIEWLSLGVYDDNTRSYLPYSAEEQAAVDAEIQTLLAQLEAAPDADAFEPLETIAVEGPMDRVFRAADGAQWTVTLTESALTVSRPGTRAYPESWFLNDPVYDGRPAPTPYQNFRITEEEARETAEAFLSVIGGENWAILTVERAGMLKEYYNALTDYQLETEGYLIRCIRSAPGAIPFDYQNSGGSRLSFDGAAYSAPLPQESLQLFVDESGIYALWWENPLEITQTVADNIELLPFKRVQQLFLQMLKNGLRWSDERPTSDGELNPTRKGIVERILLSYACVQERDAPGSFLLTPAWFFLYTTEAEKQGALHGFTTSPAVIAMNAVDGSRIALSMESSIF